ncbi:hypothetical protein EYC80_007668 [Monilinia laxa]|uniref:AB hydrolase-1 domain-containing protein n=1 Tax=Monilinia laxa TaxID=61186 RepID=A0A5N6JWM9_MONLA|nr:hypothetical protein EYC80_007668 [Monilinia laxa]
MTSHPWNNLTSQLSSCLPVFNELIGRDIPLHAFLNTAAILHRTVFAINTTRSKHAVVFSIENGVCHASANCPDEVAFSLLASPEHWAQFFHTIPVAPFQSYWGIMGMNSKHGGIQIQGDQQLFNQHAHIWRRVLEVLHEAYCGPMVIDEQPEEYEDYIIGRYVHIIIPTWGKCKVFYEQSGYGDQDIVLLHNAGSDSREYHGVMNNAAMRENCNMIAFDLPGHGRSFPPPNHCPGNYTNIEDSYVGAITAIIKNLKLKKPTICGSSMAGQVCLAVATRANEVGAGGAIPLQSCDYITTERQSNDQSPYVNQSLFNPEWIYGMMSRTASLVNKQLIWHMYSAQAYGIFHGDLDFYFGGWDGRSRMSSINTKKCPVYMLTGEYDWINTPAMSQATCDKIPGARHKSMPNLGHFPATENPHKFVPHLMEAIDWIQHTTRSEMLEDVD